MSYSSGISYSYVDNRVDALRDELQEALNTTSRGLQSNIRSLQGDIRTIRSSLEHSVSDLTNGIEQLSQLVREQNESVNDRISTISRNITKTESSIKTLRGDFDEYRDFMDNQLSQVAEHQEKLSKEIRSELTEAANRLTKRCDSLGVGIQKVEDAVSKQVKRLDAEIEQDRMFMNDLENGMKNLKTDVTKLGERLLSRVGEVDNRLIKMGSDLQSELVKESAKTNDHLLNVSHTMNEYHKDTMNHLQLSRDIFGKSLSVKHDNLLNAQSRSLDEILHLENRVNLGLDSLLGLVQEQNHSSLQYSELIIGTLKESIAKDQILAFGKEGRSKASAR